MKTGVWVLVFAFNVAVFALASSPPWYVLGVEAGLFAVYVLAKAFFSPAQRLANQAAQKGWEACGSERDENGYFDTLVKKKGMTARISYAQAQIFVIAPIQAGPFATFTEVEKHLFGSKTYL